jgi:hypothetical protein
MQTLTQQLANLNNIGIISNDNSNEYYIVAEWSVMPVESYNTITAAIDWCRGFKGLSISNSSKEYDHGAMMKECLLVDINQFGEKILKVNNIDEKYGCIVKV